MAKFLTEYYQGTIVSSGARNTVWHYFHGERWEQDEGRIITESIAGRELEGFYRRAYKYYMNESSKCAKDLVIMLTQLIKNLTKSL